MKIKLIRISIESGDHYTVGFIVYFPAGRVESYYGNGKTMHEAIDNCLSFILTSLKGITL